LSGPYPSPPEHALVLSLDDKIQIQDSSAGSHEARTTSKNERGQTITHDHKRNGTTTILFAALDIATWEIYGLCQQTSMRSG
jgi:hypothetical protein